MKLVPKLIPDWPKLAWVASTEKEAQEYRIRDERRNRASHPPGVRGHAVMSEGRNKHRRKWNMCIRRSEPRKVLDSLIAELRFVLNFAGVTAWSHSAK